MIDFRFAITNPWQTPKFKTLWNRSGKLYRHKCWELESYHYRSDIFGIMINTHWRGSDHAGFSIEFTLIGFTFGAKIYDHRHWDYTCNTWVKNHRGN